MPADVFATVAGEDGTVADSYDLTLDESIEWASDEGNRLGWVELPGD